MGPRAQGELPEAVWMNEGPLGGLPTDGSGSVLQFRGTMRHCSMELKRTSSALQSTAGGVKLGKGGFTGSVLHRRYSALQ